MNAGAEVADIGSTAKVRKGRKFDQVLAGARDVFLAQGFEGASVDDIARAAGVSKATLYSYFPDKRLLFMEVATAECCRQSDQALTEIDLTAPPQEVLEQAGHHFLTFILSDFGLSIFRICVAESDRFPDLGKQFYNSGPAVMQKTLVGYLQAAVGRKELQIEDFEMAAAQFGELCKADLWIKRIFNIKSAVTSTEIDHSVACAVDTFLARYGVN